MKVRMIEELIKSLMKFHVYFTRTNKIKFISFLSNSFNVTNYLHPCLPELIELREREREREFSTLS